MVAIWTQTLLSAAEVSNILSAVSVVICFICSVIFILRFQGMQLSTSSVVHANNTPVQVNLQKIEVPFTCCLSNSLQLPINEIHVKVKSNMPFQFKVFWRVNANNLKNVLYLPWDEFLQGLDTAESLTEIYKSETHSEFEQENSHLTQTFKLTVDHNLPPLGKPPRSHFPLVLLIRRNNINPSKYKDNVGALLSIVHISDDDCPMPTAILYHYLKQYSGQVTQLQNLFTQRTDPEVKSLISHPSHEDVEDEGPCVICRVMQPTRALLPCRHVCVCSLCFSGLDTCPLCRCRITAFFLTDANEEERQQKIHESEIDLQQINLRRHQSFLNNLNSTLNSFLGIRPHEIRT